MKAIAQTVKGAIEYRIEGQGQGRTALVLNGSHSHCDTPFGHEQFFLDRGYRVLIPSRPGYGRTPSETGRTAEAAADAFAAFLDTLQIDAVVLVAVSGGGRTALQLAARHPARVSCLILQCTLSHGGWPDTMTRRVAYLMFNPVVERLLWAAFRSLAWLTPLTALKGMMRGLSVLPPATVVARMNVAQREGALGMLTSLRSQSGFLLDVRHVCGDLSRIHTPTLIIHSRFDGGSDFSHAEYEARWIPRAELYDTPAPSHLIWYSTANSAIEAKMAAFLQATHTVVLISGIICSTT